MKLACELTSDRDPENAELPDVVGYLDKLDDVCVAKTMTYEEKSKRRATESCRLRAEGSSVHSV